MGNIFHLINNLAILLQMGILDRRKLRSWGERKHLYPIFDDSHSCLETAYLGRQLGMKTRVRLQRDYRGVARPGQFLIGPNRPCRMRF